MERMCDSVIRKCRVVQGCW